MNVMVRTVWHENGAGSCIPLRSRIRYWLPREKLLQCIFDPATGFQNERLLPHFQGKPQAAMKKKKKHACQTSINTHPDRAPEGKTAEGIEIIKR